MIKVAASGGISTPADMPDDIGFTLDELRAAVEAARHRGRTVAAHAIGTEAIALAVEAGVHSIEHGNGLTPELADRMARQGIFLLPTLTVLAQTGDPAVMGLHVYAKAAGWHAATAKALPMAIEAGVRIATGTDAGVGIQHGQNLAELPLLVQAGLSTMDAIIAGTRTAAEVCGLGDRIGTLQAGKLADAVVVAGDPLEDITLLVNPANITLVLQEGRVVKHLEPTP